MSTVISFFDHDRATEVLGQMAEGSRLSMLNLSPSERQRAQNTIEQISTINEKFQKIVLLKDDDLRNKQINILTGGGAEDGFSSNKKLLLTRIQVFTETYLKAKEKNELPAFFACFSKGDPCLSGRMESLYKHAASMEGLDVDSMPDPEKSLFVPGSIFSEIIMDKFDNGTTQAEFKTYILENLPEIAQKFQPFEESSLATAFLEYLRAGGLYSEDEKLNWESMVGSLVESKYFCSVYSQTLKYVVN